MHFALKTMKKETAAKADTLFIHINQCFAKMTESLKICLKVSLDKCLYIFQILKSKKNAKSIKLNSENNFSSGLEILTLTEVGLVWPNSC